MDQIKIVNCHCTELWEERKRDEVLWLFEGLVVWILENQGPSPGIVLQPDE